jgi:TRAP-type C4-dicarboxylate transport system permease large subunit
MKNVMDLYSYSRVWTWYAIVFFGFALVAGVQFARLRDWGRKALEIVCWVGIFNALADTTLSYMIWKNMQDTLSMVMRGMGSSQYTFVNPLGFFMIVLGFFLWIIPSVGMIIYLRRPIIRKFASQQ